MTSSRARIAPSSSNSHHSLSFVAHFALLINLAYLNRGRFVTRKIQRPAATLLIIGYPLTRLSRHRVARIRNRSLKVGPMLRWCIGASNRTGWAGPNIFACPTVVAEKSRERRTIFGCIDRSTGTKVHPSFHFISRGLYFRNGGCQGRNRNFNVIGLQPIFIDDFTRPFTGVSTSLIVVNTMVDDDWPRLRFNRFII